MQMPLTEREKQILAAVVSGRTSKEIARQLGLAPKTVAVHRSHILRKMNARNSVDLVRKAITRNDAGSP